MDHSPNFGKELAEKAGNLSDLLKILLPGESPATVHLRQAVLRFCESHVARSVLLLGPVGIGKSTIARVIALLRYLCPLSIDKRKEFLTYLRYDGAMRIDKRILDWYEELNLSGLTDSLADAQLFGVAPRSATGVVEKVGIFEAATTGHQTKPTPGAKITRGVVLLDEIGDLPEALQPKLLSVLTGTEIFRVGGEGNRDYGFIFQGTVIAAMWRDPASVLRKDLVSRLTDYTIQIPSLDDRPQDIPYFIEATVSEINRAIVDEINRRAALSDERGENLVSGEDEPSQVMEARKLHINQQDVKNLSAERWSRLGEIRGMRQVLQRVSDGSSIAEALEHQEKFSNKPSAQLGVNELADGILDLLPVSGSGERGIAGHLQEITRLLNGRIKSKLLEDRALLDRIASRIELDPSRLRKQLYDLSVKQSDENT